jgi:hypothetical protein
MTENTAIESKTTEPSTVQAPTAALPKTTGEKRYGVLKFAVAEGFILAATAVLAYVANYGKDAYKGIPNYLKKFQTWFREDLLTKKIPLSKQGEIGKLGAAAAASAMVTMHGGNLFAPFMKWFEDCKEHIVTHFNKRSGTPEEVEIAQERLKNEPKQNWGDVIKGRLSAFAIVFTSFFTAMVATGKDKKTGVYHFDKIEDWFGTKLAGFTKQGAEIAKIPIAERLNNPAVTNKTYKFGRILALDIYATTAAILIWNAISRFSANKRKKHDATHDASPVANAPVILTESPTQPVVLPRSEKIGHTLQESGSYAEMVTDKRREAQSEVLGIPG